MEKIEISVVICTYNPRSEILDRVISSLNAQSLDASKWECIIVDNNSTQIIQLPPRIGSGWRIVSEKKPGLSWARKKGIEEAKANSIVFCDDDNVLDKDYLKNALHFINAHPEVGVFGGKIIGEYEIPPPKWAIPHLSMLALREFGDQIIISDRKNSILASSYDFFAPYGAGMVLRAEIAKSYTVNISRNIDILSDRRGTSLGGCGDCEMVMQSYLDGFECAYNPQIIVKHLIPVQTFTYQYFCKLAYEGQFSWGKFQTKYGLTKHIPKWTVPFRQLRAFFVRRAWTRSGYISWLKVCGYWSGLASS